MAVAGGSSKSVPAESTVGGSTMPIPATGKGNRHGGSGQVNTCNRKRKQARVALFHSVEPILRYRQTDSQVLTSRATRCGWLCSSQLWGIVFAPKKESHMAKKQSHPAEPLVKSKIEPPPVARFPDAIPGDFLLPAEPLVHSCAAELPVHSKTEPPPPFFRPFSPSLALFRRGFLQFAALLRVWTGWVTLRGTQ